MRRGRKPGRAGSGGGETGVRQAPPLPPYRPSSAAGARPQSGLPGQPPQPQGAAVVRLVPRVDAQEDVEVLRPPAGLEPPEQVQPVPVRVLADQRLARVQPLRPQVLEQLPEVLVPHVPDPKLQVRDALPRLPANHPPQTTCDSGSAPSGSVRPNRVPVCNRVVPAVPTNPT